MKIRTVLRFLPETKHLVDLNTENRGILFQIFCWSLGGQFIFQQRFFSVGTSNTWQDLVHNDLWALTLCRIFDCSHETSSHKLQ